jgi:hypothetical protein
LTPFRIRLLIGIFVLLSCVYMLTYSAHFESSDTWYLFNAVGSLVHFGDWGQDLTADEKFPTPESVPANNPYPIQNLIDDPLSVVLATPLYWLADKLPGVGLVHMVWLFNVFMAAAGACVLFIYVLTLGYDERVGVVAALAFGLGTIVWIYSKTFFQENLTLLVTLSLGLSLECWRQSRYRSWRALLCVIVFAICLPFSKWTSVIAAPALLLIALPAFIKTESRLGRWMPYLEVGVLAVIGIFFVLLAYTGLGRVLPGVDLYNRYFYILTIYPEYIQVAMQSYLFSIGASIWGTSPILLLAIPGGWWLFRQRKTRYLWVTVVIVGGYTLGYAMTRSVHWFSGLSFPPRFLVPLIPFLMLCALPVLERMLNGKKEEDKTNRQEPHPLTPSPSASLGRGGIDLLWLVFTVLMVYGVWIQLSGLSLRWTVYPTLLPPDTGVAWGGGMNSVAYLRWVVLPRLWGQLPFDFVWVRTQEPLWAVMFTALAVASEVWLFKALTAKLPLSPQPPSLKVGGRGSKAGLTPLKSRFSSSDILSTRGLIPLFSGLRNGVFKAARYAVLPLALVVCTYVGLRLIYDDPEYFSYYPALFEMLPIVEAETQAGDVVLVTGREHRQFLLNYGTSEQWRGIGISYIPGERYDPNVAPLVSADNLVNPTAEELLPLLPVNTPWLIEQLAARRSRLWVWAEFGPDMAWTVRPLERYLTRLYYPVQEFRTAAAVRLIEYDTTPAPTEPQTESDLVYGDVIRLRGVSLPRGTEYRGGDILPISLYWEADETVTQDYTVALFLANEAAVVAQGMDGAPDGGFSRTSLWAAGTDVQDNRTLRLPVGLAAGEYQFWLVLYPTGTDGSERLSVTGVDVREGTIAVLPVRIAVR